jgi:hypothetical protein
LAYKVALVAAPVPPVVQLTAVTTMEDVHVVSKLAVCVEAV